MESVSFPELPPLIGTPEKQNLNKFCDCHGDRSHNTNDCYQLKKQIEEVGSPGQGHPPEQPTERELRKEQCKGETYHPLGIIDLRVTMGKAGRNKTVLMEFAIIKCRSPYYVIIGRTRMRSLGATPEKGARWKTGIERKGVPMAKGRDDQKGSTPRIVKEGRFLGHMVTEEGVREDLEKVQAIILSPTPKSPNQIRSLFLQLTAISKFIPKLVELKYPIREVRMRFERAEGSGWMNEAEEALRRIKRKLRHFLFQRKEKF
ncbi:hypothetical protein Tco_0738400 [Tanacetum coccineum]